MKTDYEQQAEQFLKDTETEMEVKYLKYDKYFDDDKDKRDIYFVRFKRGNRAFDLNFGQSINNSLFRIVNKNTGRVTHKWSREQLKDCFTNGKLDCWKFVRMYFPLTSCDEWHEPQTPIAYDVLACLTKYDPSTFENFCAEYGYDEDSRKAERVYKAVVDEWKNVAMLWNDEEMERLQEIQ